MNERLLTEQRNPASFQIDTKTTEEILRIINTEDKKVAFVVEDCIPNLTKLVDSVVSVFQNGGRLFYLGAGTSGRLGVLDASECPPTYGVSPEMVQGIIAGGDGALRKSIENAEDNPELGVEQLKNAQFSKSDMLIGITASGSAPYVIGAMKYAQELKSPVAAISCNTESLTFKYCDFPVCLPVGPEIVTGSTRMKSGTAQKLVLNMITTTAMIRIGKVYNNFMIDLVPSNSKLLKRSLGLIQEITNCDEKTAKDIFEASGNQIRVAVIMIMLQIGKEEAESILNATDKNINKAVDLFMKNKEKKVGKE